MKIVFLEKESLGQGIDFEPFSTIGEVTYYDSTRKEQVEERISMQISL